MSGTEDIKVKQCCSAFYGSDLARLLLGESFHPGGTRLTERLGRLMELDEHARVLDAAAGRGTSAVYLAQTFGCEVVGVDLSEENIRVAAEQASLHGVASRVSFQAADAERLPFADDSFDAVICECAFCTFPDKPTVAAEFRRVLKPGGRVGISDLTKAAAPLPELEGLLSWIACVGDAQPMEMYRETLRRAGLVVTQTEDHSEALMEMVRQVQGRLLGMEVAAALKKLDISGIDLPEGKRFAQAALNALKKGSLGYAVIIAVKPG